MHELPAASFFGVIECYTDARNVKEDWNTYLDQVPKKRCLPLPECLVALAVPRRRVHAVYQVFDDYDVDADGAAPVHIVKSIRQSLLLLIFSIDLSYFLLKQRLLLLGVVHQVSVGLAALCGDLDAEVGGVGAAEGFGFEVGVRGVVLS